MRISDQKRYKTLRKRFKSLGMSIPDFVNDDSVSLKEKCAMLSEILEGNIEKNRTGETPEESLHRYMNLEGWKRNQYRLVKIPITDLNKRDANIIGEFSIFSSSGDLLHFHAIEA